MAETTRQLSESDRNLIQALVGTAETLTGKADKGFQEIIELIKSKKFESKPRIPRAAILARAETTLRGYNPEKLTGAMKDLYDTIQWARETYQIPSGSGVRCREYCLTPGFGETR